MVLAIISYPTVLSPHGFGEHTVCVRKYKKTKHTHATIQRTRLMRHIFAHKRTPKYIITDSSRKFVKLQERMSNVERGKSAAECKMWNVGPDCKMKNVNCKHICKMYNAKTQTQPNVLLNF